ncbi:MAG: TonB-dependent receptor [Ignavibacteriales bacterium]|nr:TonB-dependent receptor [Ignavibacteriales bacterium]
MKNLLAAALLFLPTILFPQAKGTIRGRVIDAKSKDGLPAVNIKVKGTYYGAVSDIDGNFRVQNVSPGSYTVEITLIGYTTIQRTGVTVEEDKEIIINEEMSETVLSIGQEVIVVGEKPLFNLEETSSRRSVTSEDLKSTAVADVKEVVTQQVGVVQTDNEIHIRGGRSNENAYLLDGVSIQDPLAGTGFGLQLSTEAVQEVQVITGGYNAEYGQATSGVVNVSLKEGSSSYQGSLAHKRDHIGLAESSFPSFNSDIYEATLSGPEPVTGILLPLLGQEGGTPVTFFTNIYAGLSDGYTRKAAGQLISSTFHGSRFTPKQDNNWFWLAKVSWRVAPMAKLAYTYTHSVAINQNSQSLQTNLEYVEASPGYQYEFENILDDANTYTHNNQIHSISLTHTLSNTFFYELKFSHFFTNLRADANGKYYTEYREPKDIVTFPIDYYNLGRDTVGVVPGDGLWDFGNGFTWHDHYVSENTIKLDVTNHFSEKNKFKAGFELTLQEMQNIDIYQPWVGRLGLNNDIYKVNPMFGALYAQDNITFSGMILNVGLRFDYWAPGKYVDDAVENPAVLTIPDQIRQDYRDKTFSLFGRRMKARLSPRIGISHPVSDNQMLFFSYGHFSKRPKPQFVYAKLNPANAQSTFQKFGNPDLDPETTVSYEIGLQTQFTNNDVLTVTAYYKDIFDYVSTKQARLTTARLSTGNFVTYVNQDYARSRGVEVEFRKRIGQWYRGNVSGSYSVTTGKSSSPDQGLLVARGDDFETIKENYVVWDRPLQFNLNSTFNVVKGEPLFGFGEGILDDYSVYVRLFFQSGKRYTPVILADTLFNGRPNYVTDRSNILGKVGQDWFWVDVNLEKSFSFAGLQFTLSVNVKNLTDRKNSAIINPVTGRAYEAVYDASLRKFVSGDATPTGWNDPLYPDLQAPVSAFPFNPARYLAGRNLLVGLSMRF